MSENKSNNFCIFSCVIMSLTTKKTKQQLINIFHFFYDVSLDINLLMDLLRFTQIFKDFLLISVISELNIC